MTIVIAIMALLFAIGLAWLILNYRDGKQFDEHWLESERRLYDADRKLAKMLKETINKKDR